MKKSCLKHHSFQKPQHEDDFHTQVGKIKPAPLLLQY